MVSFSRAGLTFDVRDGGPADGEPVVLLHGFPADSTCWSGVEPALQQAGFRTLAPDQRGYSPGARPAGRSAYRVAELVGDVVALLDAAGLDRVHLVGHDWGGGVGWAAAAAVPERITSLCVVSTPHPRALARTLVTVDQARRSWYMGAFQLPWLPERLLLRDGGRSLRSSLERSGLDPGRARHYVDRLLEPGALTAALNWYRALPLDVVRAARSGPVAVPTLYVWGAADFALGRRAAEDTRRWVTAPYEFVELDGVSHWVPEQAPERLVPPLLGHLKRWSGS